MFRLLSVLLCLVILFSHVVKAGECAKVFQKSSVVYSQAQPLVVQAQNFAYPLHFQVGQNIVNDAIAETLAEKVFQKIQTKMNANNFQSSNKVESAQVSTETKKSVLEQKCMKCHTSSNAKGGVVLSEPTLDSVTSLRIIDMLLRGSDVPDVMKPVVEKLTAEDKGAIVEELLQKKIPLTK